MNYKYLQGTDKMSSTASDSESPISVKILRDGDMTVDKDVGKDDTGKDNPKHFKDFIDDGKLKNIVPPWLRGSLEGEDLKELSEFETANEKRVRQMMKDKTYQFVCLLAGFTNQDMHQFWNADEMEATQGGVRDPDGTISFKQEMYMTTSGRRATGNLQNNDGDSLVSGSDDEDVDNEDQLKKANMMKLHNWYQNNDFACPSVYLTPMAYSHIEEAMTALTQRYHHLEDAKLEHFINAPKIRCLFARLVAMCIRMSDVLSGKQYQLDANYRRINYERTRLMTTFKNVQLRGDVLVFEKRRRYTRVGEGTILDVPSVRMSSNWYNRNGVKMFLN